MRAMRKKLNIFTLQLRNFRIENLEKMNAVQIDCFCCIDVNAILIASFLECEGSK